MRIIPTALILVLLASGCSTPETRNAPAPSSASHTFSSLFEDIRPSGERKSLVELESYRTLVSLGDDALNPSAASVFGEAVRNAKLPAPRSVQLLTFRVQISLPPSKTSYAVYQAMNLPDGPPDAKRLMSAVSKSLAQSPSGAALVVCEVETQINGKPYRSLVRESYRADLSLSAVVTHMKQAAAEALAESAAMP